MYHDPWKQVVCNLGNIALIQLQVKPTRGKYGTLVQAAWCIMVPGSKWSPSLTAWGSAYLKGTTIEMYLTHDC